MKDSVPLFNEIIVALGLPRSGADAQAEEFALGRMSEFLTEFDHVVRRAAPSSL